MVSFKKEIISPEWNKYQFSGEKKIHFYRKFDTSTILYTQVLLHISKERKDFEIVFHGTINYLIYLHSINVWEGTEIVVLI